MVAKERDRAACVLQLGDIQIEEHPVDALELEGDVAGENVCDATA